MTKSKSTIKTNSADIIPWISILKHHLEIASKATQDFFVISEQNNSNSSWIENPPVKSLIEAKWQIKTTDISNELNLALQNTKKDYYLGGLSTRGYNKDTKKIFDYPIFYRKIRYEFNKQLTKINIIADETIWGICPLFVEKISKEFNIKNDDIVNLIEEAKENLHKYNKGDTNDYFKNLLIEIEKSIGIELISKKDIFNKWAIFAPPEKLRGYNSNLIKDYENIIDLLDKDPTAIGGFKNITPNLSFKESNTHNLPIPFISLNPAQKVVVEKVINNEPLVVVTGPPGTGKTQSVCSILLNQWANGNSVLFTSANNEAIQNVIQKLDSYEPDLPMPIYIRGGKELAGTISSRLLKSKEALRLSFEYSEDKVNSYKSTILKYEDKKIELEKIIENNKQYELVYENYLSIFDTYLEQIEMVNIKRESQKQTLQNNLHERWNITYDIDSQYDELIKTYSFWKETI
jgi:KaiC/GvpD/RAD55 family RecA-like ATPase